MFRRSKPLTALPGSREIFTKFWDRLRAKPAAKRRMYVAGNRLFTRTLVLDDANAVKASRARYIGRSHCGSRGHDVVGKRGPLRGVEVFLVLEPIALPGDGGPRDGHSFRRGEGNRLDKGLVDD